MKKLMFIMLLGLTSCTEKEYRYEISGKVYVPTAGPNPMHDAIWELSDDFKLFYLRQIQNCKIFL